MLINSLIYYIKGSLNGCLFLHLTTKKYEFILILKNKFVLLVCEKLCLLSFFCFIACRLLFSHLVLYEFCLL